MRAPKNFLKQELARLNQKRGHIFVKKVPIKDDLNDLRQKPNTPSAVSILGNQITKSPCDNRNSKGHRSIMNRGSHVPLWTAICPDIKHSVTEVGVCVITLINTLILTNMACKLS